MDYEEMMLQVTDVLKAHNRHHMNAPDHEQAVKAIRDIVTPKGHWRSVGFEKGYAFCICSNCGKTTKLVRDNRNEFCCIADIREKAVACLYCGADMRGDEV